MQAEQGGRHQAETGNDLPQVDRVTDKLIRAGGHQATGLGNDAEPVAEIAQRVKGQDHAAGQADVTQDRKSTRLNSSHTVISYAVFCLKKKKKKEQIR